jgi:DUF1009 family protein
VTRYGLIAGNGRFPLLALESARQLGYEITVIAIQEEASKEVETLADRCHWISLGQLGKLIEICKRDGITEVMMCGQVKHAKIFSSIAADWRLLKLLATLPSKNTDGLIGGVIKILADEGIQLRDSTMLLKPALRRCDDAPPAGEGRLTDIAYGRRVANAQPVSTWDRALPSASALAWRWKPWKAPTPCCRAATLVNGRRITWSKSPAAASISSSTSR